MKISARATPEAEKAMEILTDKLKVKPTDIVNAAIVLLLEVYQNEEENQTQTTKEAYTG